MTPRNLTAALHYLDDLGWVPVPLFTPIDTGCDCADGPGCKSPGKHPRVGWARLVTSRPDAAMVRGWWARWPAANVGVLTGMVSGLAVLDIDPRNGGLETLADLDARGWVMPDDNPLVETGSLGMHHYFRLTTPLPKAAPFDGIEFQADGALVVAPPSLHKSGRLYTWTRGPAHTLPAVPDWLRAVVDHVEPRRPEASWTPPSDAAQDDVLTALRTRGLYIGSRRRLGTHRIHCPWAEQHSNGDSEAVVWEPDATHGWGFKCLHAHCAERRIGQLLDYLAIPKRRAA